MPNTYTTLSGLFAAIANAIRAKKGTTDTIVADNFPSEIESIASQPSLQSKTVSPSTDAQTITPDSRYDGLSQVVVNAISPTKGAQTYTPTTTDQTISSGRWLTGAQTIKGDANLVAANIKSGVSIFGVNGNYSGQYKFSCFSGINPYADKEFRIPVDSDVAQVVGFAVKLTNNFEATTNEMLCCMWWNNGTVSGGNMGVFHAGSSYGTTYNNFSSPIPIGGTSSNKYAQLMLPINLNWSYGHAHEGFIVYNV